MSEKEGLWEIVVMLLAVAISGVLALFGICVFCFVAIASFVVATVALAILYDLCTNHCWR